MAVLRPMLRNVLAPTITNILRISRTGGGSIPVPPPPIQLDWAQDTITFAFVAGYTDPGNFGGVDNLIYDPLGLMGLPTVGTPVSPFFDFTTEPGVAFSLYVYSGIDFVNTAGIGYLMGEPTGFTDFMTPGGVGTLYGMDGAVLATAPAVYDVSTGFPAVRSHFVTGGPLANGATYYVSFIKP